MAFVWTLLPFLASVEYSGQTYNDRKVVDQTTTFRSCTFKGQSDQNGAGLFLANNAYELGLMDCFFDNCNAYGSGGRGSGLFVSQCLAFSLNGTSGTQCYAAGDSFCYVYAANVFVYQSRASSCVGTDVTFWFEGPDSGVPTASIISLNSTSNHAAPRASGLCVESYSQLSLHFCTFSGNEPTNCLVLGRGITGSDISCLGLFNNRCASDASYPG
jgi:hypothetical protein